MNEFTSPCCNSGSLMPKDLAISNQPNIPSSYKDYFKKEGVSKTPFSRHNANLDRVLIGPLYLQKFPNLDAKIACK